MVLNRSIACAPSPCGPPLAVSRLGGRYPADYYGHSVAIGLASLRRSHVHHCCTSRARIRRPVRLLQYPDRASLLRPGGLRREPDHLAAGAGAGYRHLSGGRLLAPSGDWDSGNPAFAISRGSPGAPSLTPGRGHRFPGMLFSLASFRIPVSHQIQRYLLSSLPAARAIQQCATWRTRAVKPSAQPTLVRTQHLPHAAKTPR